MSRKVIIGLAGVKTSGKSTAANIIKDLFVEKEGTNVLESALADKLKNVCSEVFNISREYFDKQELKEVPFDNPKVLFHDRIVQILESFNIEVTEELMQVYYTNDVIDMVLETPRKIAQIVGTEVLRAAGDEDVHCKNVALSDGVTVISDLRFPNEFTYFSENPGVFFLPMYIQRDEAEKHVTEDSHPSEKCVFEFSSNCFKIDNNGTIDNTKKQIEDLLLQTEFIETLNKEA